jgi:multiple sugar transport system substrate-binding protein
MASDGRARMGAARGRTRVAMLVGVVAVAVLATACGGPGRTPMPPGWTPYSYPPDPNIGNVRWFIGVGQGTQPAQIEAEKAFVSSYRARFTGVNLSLEIVPNDRAIDTLKTEIAAGNPPDIIGPIGTSAAGELPGLFLDLNAEIKAQKFDNGAYEQALLMYLQQGGAQFGLPYTVYPGFLFYNKDIFAKAKLPALPTKIGETYMGQTWDWGEVRGLAAQLTLDTNGRKASEVGFDYGHTVQYGLSFQWADARRIASTFGGGSFVAPDGVTAQIPDGWTDAFTWYHDAIWRGRFTPTAAGTACALALLSMCPSRGDPAYGQVAMTTSWPWAIPSYVPNNVKDGPGKFSGWDMAVMPSWKGQTTSPMDGDGFQITKASRNPALAFKAMVAIINDLALRAALGGGMPARSADQKTWFDEMDKAQAVAFPANKVTWSVLQEMARHPALPSLDAFLPNNAKSKADIDAFLTTLQNKPTLDVAAELAKLKATLQADFDAVKPLA